MENKKYILIENFNSSYQYYIENRIENWLRASYGNDIINCMKNGFSKNSQNHRYNALNQIENFHISQDKNFAIIEISVRYSPNFYKIAESLNSLFEKESLRFDQTKKPSAKVVISIDNKIMELIEEKREFSDLEIDMIRKSFPEIKL